MNYGKEVNSRNFSSADDSHYTVIHRLMHCYQTIRQIAKKLVEGWRVCSRMARRGIYSASACSVSKSHNEYTDIKCNAHDLMQLYQSLSGEVSMPPH